jgi:diguanylate cyclase (GGDEF)-like protein
MRKVLIRRIIFSVLIITFVFSCSCISRNAFAEEIRDTKKVLILNSYHQGFTWTNEETSGIMDYLSNSDMNMNTMVEYLDWKNYPTTDNLIYLYDYFLYKYQNEQIDIIITTDDKALNFAIEHRADLFSDAPIVFCGVNQEGYEKIAKNQHNVTGTLELIDPTETIRIAKSINSDVKNIYLLSDNSESGLSTGKIVTDSLKEIYPDLNIVPCNEMNYKDILEQVRRLNDDSIVLITTYFTDVDNNILDLEYITREVSANSSVPVYHLYDFGLNDGALGGAMLSGRLQGEQAAGLAVRILHGEDVDKVTIIQEPAIRTAFNYDQLVRFGVSLKVLPKDSEIINKPFSFFETYKTLVISVIASFIVLILFLLILLFYIGKIKKMKRKIAESHEELTQIYEELAASDEDMRQQYEELLEANEKIREGEEKLSYLAYHDSLTGLPNKLSLYEASKAFITERKCKIALFFIDLDNFKYVNDTLGHAIGDQLIIQVSERLSSLLEKKYSLYRLSGDEFIIILEGIKEIEDAKSFASRILNSLSAEFIINNSILHISLSIGIVFYPEHGNELEQLLKYADIAMYRAKDLGRKNYVVYDELMNKAFTERVEIEKNLHNALENNEFEVYYQPQYDLKNHKISGLEALLRWKNHNLGSVSPLKFIKVAEDTHDIIPIGTWVLEKACSFLKELHNKGFRDLSVSVNISILQLLQTDFCDIVSKTLNELQIDPESLELEITETMLIESFDTIIPRLNLLSDMKIRIALDDFGMGYSSLNYLKKLPINTLKVDKSFVDHILDLDRNTLAGQIINIGKCLGMCVIAEGVEQQEQLEYLLQYDCDKIQGYLYSKPITANEVIKLLEKENN